MSNTKRRIYWVDNIRGLLVLFVVCFHYRLTPTAFVNFVYPFTLSFFFASSGYFFRQKNERFLVFLLKKIRAYMPIIVINALISCVLDGMTGESILTMLKKIVCQIYGCESLWFIACMLITQIIMYWIVKLCKGHALKVAVLCVACSGVGLMWTALTAKALPWSADIALVQMLFLGIGYWYRQNEERVKSVLHNGILLYIVVYVALVFVAPYSDIHRRSYDCIWLYHIQAVLGIVTLVSATQRWCDRRIPVICYLGKNSLYVYAFHGYVLTIFNKLVSIVLGERSDNYPVLMTVCAVVITALTMYVCIKAWNWLKNTYKESQKFDVRKNGSRNGQIEGVRAIALILVMTYHYLFRFCEIYGGKPAVWAADLGVYGVTAFLIISGIYGKGGGGSRTIGEILLDNVSKIVKLWIPYLSAITFTFVITRWVNLPGRTVGMREFVLNACFLNGFVGVSYVDAAHWYLTQMIGFIAVVTMLQCMRVNQRRWAYGAWLLIAAVCYLIQQYGQIEDDLVKKLIGLIRLIIGGEYAGAYIAGVALSFIIEDDVRGTRWASIMLMAGAIVVYSLSHGVVKSLVLCAELGVVCMAMWNRAKLLGFRPLVLMGSVSYGVYLIHQNIGYIIMRALPGWCGLCLAGLAAVLLGWALSSMKKGSDIAVTRCVKQLKLMKWKGTV